MIRRTVMAAALLAVTAGSALAQPDRIATVPGAPTPDHVVDVLTYNLALLPEIAASTRQAERAALVAPHLRGYDVVVLQEAFVDRWRDAIVGALADEYPYRTAVVGRDGARGLPFRQDGGVLILSRWPILREAQVTFDDVCAGTDCLADKGVSYAAVRKGGRTVHVFGTHAQSLYGPAAPAVRAAQFDLLRAFVDALGLPAGEVVLFAGDFNVDAATSERDDMLRRLGATWPTLRGDLRYSWDPETNTWAHGPRQVLDYVLVASDHERPVLAWNQVVPLRDGGMDLSDHHAVWARVVMAEP